MRTRRSNAAGLKAVVVAGGHVVSMGWDLPRAVIEAKRVHGFGIRRTRHSDGEVIWLLGSKTFQSVVPNPAPGVGVSTRYHPIQGFQWSDYTASPGQDYTYRIAAIAGDVAHPVIATYVDARVTTESVDLGRHAIFFNRGAIASQEYARRFLNRKPRDVGQAALDWLSRGLVEGLLEVIASAGQGDALNAAFYEFKNIAVMQAFRAAATRGATVRIVYDGKSEKLKNEKGIDEAGIRDLVIARTRTGNLMHNKFLVLSRGGVAQEVWTGSTNLTENGIYGHSNNAHIVRDHSVASSYLRYWQLLADDRTRAEIAAETSAFSPAPAPSSASDTDVVFSPRSNLDALAWFASLASGAKNAVFMTFAFGMNSSFVPGYSVEDDVLRYALMDKTGSGSKKKEQSAVVARIRRLRNVIISVGSFIPVNGFDRWLGETPKASASHNVLYVHTKYMLVDPMSDSPTVVVGSANFSDGSTKTNDENMLVIRGNTAVADVYLGEFMRLFSHYSFRESVTRFGLREAGALDENLEWVGRGYFDATKPNYLKRLYFSGQKVPAQL